MTLPKSGGPELVDGQATLRETTVNEMARALDAGFSRAIIEDRDLSAAPGTCADGANYLVAGTPGGGDAWAGQTGKMATAVGTNAINGWDFKVVAVEGFVLAIKDENVDIRFDGAAWQTVGTSGKTTRPSAFFIAALDASECFLQWSPAAGETATFSDDFGGANGHCGSPPASSFVIDVLKNGSGVGTITISTGGAFTFATTGGSVAFTDADVMEWVGPASADPACANVSVTLKGTL
jgi:hypothetical protein